MERPDSVSRVMPPMTTIRKTSAATANSQLGSAPGRAREAAGAEAVAGAVKGAWEAMMRDMAPPRSEEHTSELQSLMRISYAVFCLKKKNNKYNMCNHP